MKSHDANTDTVRTMRSAPLTGCDTTSKIKELCKKQEYLFQRLNNIIQDDCREEAVFELLSHKVHHWKSVT